MTLCDPMDYTVHGIFQARLLGSLSLLKGIFPTQGLNPGLTHCRQILYQLSHQGSLTFKDLVYRNRASLVAQLVKNPLAMRMIWVRSLGWEDPLEKGEASHSNILA